ncbi:hypothetical protein NPIL_205351 [Nephila pilipes]|uniref:Uncharacterized protein n=1 Tax=Nephila pilipes TaxID=299642 RepID=A0A8X6M5I1_NEPPI|nr:hypothetical protein NPIL_205351 [Nephila pilipes]
MCSTSRNEVGLIAIHCGPEDEKSRQSKNGTRTSPKWLELGVEVECSECVKLFYYLFPLEQCFGFRTLIRCHFANDGGCVR